MKDVTPQEIGEFIDQVSDSVKIPRRAVQAVANRALDEMVELALECGLSANEIMGVVADALHNQCLKRSRKLGVTVFPSELVNVGDFDHIPGEIADVQLVLKDLRWIIGNPDIGEFERSKLRELQSSRLHVSEKGTVRRVKPHII